MMKQTIQYCGGNGAVIIKDFRPVFESPVGSEYDRAFLIAVTDDLEQ